MRNCLSAANNPEILAEKKESARKGNPATVSGAVAVLPLYGPINDKMDLMTWLMGGTALNDWMQNFRSLVHDPNVGAIILDVDSPGGSVFGVDEASEEIYKARGKKPIIAMSSPIMASAAYYIASAADEIVATPTSQTGSIGVIIMHEDMSAALDAEGVKLTAITYGQNKAEANWWEPLSEESKSYLQGRVDAYGQMFTKAVARNRKLTMAHVNEHFGQGRMLMSQDALAVGMVDRIGTMDDVMRDLGVKNQKTMRAALAAVDAWNAIHNGWVAPPAVEETTSAPANEVTEAVRKRVLDMI